MFEYWKHAMVDNYANFNGRASRAEYWWTYLVNTIGSFALFVIGPAIHPAFFVVSVLAMLVFIIPGLAAGVRRLHDTGRSGANIWFSLIPFVGVIILIVFLAGEGQRVANQYGPVPAR